MEVWKKNRNFEVEIVVYMEDTIFEKHQTAGFFPKSLKRVDLILLGNGRLSAQQKLNFEKS